MRYKIIFRVISFILIFLILFYNSDKLIDEPVRFTNSISYNLKLYNVHKNIKGDVSIATVGGSLSLNEINSDVIVKSFPQMSYYNFSSWGLTLKDIYDLARIIVEVYHPKYIITCTQMIQFYGKDITNINQIDIKSYLSGCPSLLYKKNYGFIDKSDYTKNILNRNIYDTLLYDNYGGAPLDVYGSNISDERWDHIFDVKFDSKNVQYKYLDKLSKYLSDKRVKFIFINGPARYNYVNNASVSLDNMKLHKEKCKEILKNNNQYYYDATNYEKYPDDCFADYIHMNEEGSILFTKELVDYLLKENIIK